MRTISVLLLAAALLSPALAEEEVIPDHTFQDVHDNWQGLVGKRVKIVGGFIAQAGMGEGYAALIEAASSDVIDIDTSKSTDPAAVAKLKETCGNFLTADKPDCRFDVVATVEKNPLRDVPVLVEPTFVAPAS